MPAPRPKKSTPAIVVPSPWRTVAALQPAAAARSASAVSLLPGTSTVGVSIPDSAPMVSSKPSCTEAKSPAPITTSASADISTNCAPCSRSRCRSLKARIFIPENLAARCQAGAPEAGRPPPRLCRFLLCPYLVGHRRRLALAHQLAEGACVDAGVAQHLAFEVEVIALAQGGDVSCSRRRLHVFKPAVGSSWLRVTVALPRTVPTLVGWYCSSEILQGGSVCSRSIAIG